MDRSFVPFCAQASRLASMAPLRVHLGQMTCPFVPLEVEIKKSLPRTSHCCILSLRVVSSVRIGLHVKRMAR